MLKVRTLIPNDTAESLKKRIVQFTGDNSQVAHYGSGSTER